MQQRIDLAAQALEANNREHQATVSELARLAAENSVLQAKHAERVKKSYGLGDAVYIEVNTVLNRYYKVGEAEMVIMCLRRVNNIAM